MEEKIADTDFLTTKRFDKTRSETLKALERLRNNETINSGLIEQINEEDIVLQIKARSFKRSKRQMLLSFVFIITGYVFKSITPAIMYLVIIGGILAISSFWGILSNRISKKMYYYIMN